MCDAFFSSLPRLLKRPDLRECCGKKKTKRLLCLPVSFVSEYTAEGKGAVDGEVVVSRYAGPLSFFIPSLCFPFVLSLSGSDVRFSFCQRVQSVCLKENRQAIVDARESARIQPSVISLSNCGCMHGWRDVSNESDEE